MTPEKAIELIVKELGRATAMNGPFRSAHEGFAVIHEEFDELKAEVWKKEKDRNNRDLVQEATQVAAMGLRFLIDICEEPNS